MHDESPSQTFNRRLAIGFSITILLALALGMIGFNATFTISRDKDQILADYSAEMYEVAMLNSESERRVSSSRAYLLTGDEGYLARMKHNHDRFLEHLELLDRVEQTPAGDEQIRRIRELDEEYSLAIDRLIKRRQKSGSTDSLSGQFESEVQPRRESLTAALQSYVGSKKQELDAQFERSRERSATIRNQILVLTAIACSIGMLLSVFIWRTLTTLYNELARAARLREEILAMVSHDLKNPIQAIQLWVELEQRKSSPAANLSTLKSSAERMRGLVSGLLDFARIEAGQMHVEPGPVSVNDLFEETRKLFQSIAAARNLNFEIQNPAESLLLWADRERILQVLSNLIGNALKFTPAAGAVQVRAEGRPQIVRFVVQDSGPGIAREDQERIFDRFWHASRAARGGSGLGLAICKGIVTAHGGRIWVESEPGHGSQFCFELPRRTPVA